MDNIIYLVNITNYNDEITNLQSNNINTYYYKFNIDINEEYIFINNIIYFKNEFNNELLFYKLKSIISFEKYNYLLLNKSCKELDNLYYDKIYYINNKIEDIYIYDISKDIIVIINMSEYIFNSYIILNDVLSSLNNQILKPKLIILNILDSTKQCINYTDSNIIINHGNNILNLIDIINKEDKLIFIPYNFIPDKNMTLMYGLCYELYECEGITINKINSQIIFNDNNENVLFNLNNSYSFKYSSINKNKMYTCTINKSVGNLVDNSNITTPFYIDIIDPIFENKIIKPRNLLYNVLNISYIYSKNDKYIDIKYYNESTIILTITYLKNIKLIDTISLIIDENKEINILTNNKNLFNKITLFININDLFNNNIYKIEYNQNPINLIQINNDNNFYLQMITINKFPDMNYLLFNMNDIDEYMNKNKFIKKQ
jgi:hypothetical protein